jgi:predicted peroxiredoxin
MLIGRKTLSYQDHNPIILWLISWPYSFAKSRNRVPPKEESMKLLRILVVLAIVLAGLVHVASAGSSDPLFVNLSTDDNHRANMAIALSKEMLKHGHPVTIYMNSQAVQIANKNNTRYAMQQKKLAEFINKGGTVLVCPVCEKYLHINQADLIPGVQLSNAKAVDQALFRENTKALSW